MAEDITYADLTDAIGDTAIATMITNASLPSSTLPPAEFLWKVIKGYKKAQDQYNADEENGTLPSLATIDLLQMGPTVEIFGENNRPYIRGRAQIQCNIFLDDNDVQGVTVI
ncbi:hypothetical protein QUA41_30590 [Microcoleus sp. Pol11C1]|uniref:hypothetical protein n=1 Tax=unclassified Microcoleus TaxID=2642155 RepID=UPI002FD309D2